MLEMQLRAKNHRMDFFVELGTQKLWQEVA
jgi:hypothetical protein